MSFYCEMMQRLERIFFIFSYGKIKILASSCSFLPTYCFCKEWHHEHLQGTVACISGPVVAGVIRAGWRSPSREERPFSLCSLSSPYDVSLWTVRMRMFSSGNGMSSTSSHITRELTLHLQKYYWQIVGARGKPRGGGIKPSRRSKLQLSPWGTAYWELSLHVSSPQTEAKIG